METLKDELGALNDLATGPEFLRTKGFLTYQGWENWFLMLTSELSSTERNRPSMPIAFGA
jgi:hypothetical protein